MDAQYRTPPNKNKSPLAPPYPQTTTTTSSPSPALSKRQFPSTNSVTSDFNNNNHNNLLNNKRSSQILNNNNNNKNGNHPSPPTTLLPGLSSRSDSVRRSSVPYFNSATPPPPVDSSVDVAPDTIWITDPEQSGAFVRRKVISRNDTHVIIDDQGAAVKVPVSELYEDNPQRFKLAEDISTLPHANEPGILDCLNYRYSKNYIYTFSGLFLVAVNPYRDLGIYTPQIASEFISGSSSFPHIFAVAAKAYQGLSPVYQNSSQSILITGESGAGKTENTKRVVQWLMSLSTDHSRGAEHLEAGILDANPVLEAFGNAKTLRNDNSSRFGKYIKIHFSESGGVLAAHIDWYLLEKSRVTRRRERERTFHVFYMLLLGAGQKLLSKLGLKNDPNAYKCVQGEYKIDKRDDAQYWKSLLDAFNTLGFSESIQNSIFFGLAAILHLSNINLASSSSNSQAYIKDEDSLPLETAARLLGVTLLQLKETLLNPSTKAGQETFRQSRNRDQVSAEISALSRSLYERIFGKVVSRINDTLRGPEELLGNEKFIGVLDIAGFEVVEKNGFEQLCINYTNERLQQLFNECMFLHEQAEYQAENIDWHPIDFGLDLQPTIELIESNAPPGLLSCIDEASIVPGGSDEMLISRLDEVAKKRGSQKYQTSRFGQSFVMKHYAGSVEYQTDGWLDTNKDPLSDGLFNLLSSSQEPFIAELFSSTDNTLNNTNTNGNGNINGNGNGTSPVPPNESPGTLSPMSSPRTPQQNRQRRNFRSGAFRTVSQRHREQLSSLMRQLRSTETQFVRCILPNNVKQPGLFDDALVLEQLRCNGVLEGIRISTLGFPNRCSFADFVSRYSFLVDPNAPITASKPVTTSNENNSVNNSNNNKELRQECLKLIDCLEITKDKAQVGVTKVFLKAKVLAELDRKRDAYLSDMMAKVQALSKGFISRKHFSHQKEKLKAARIIEKYLYKVIMHRRNLNNNSPWFDLVERVSEYSQKRRQQNKRVSRLNEQERRDQNVQHARERIIQVESESEAVSLLQDQVDILKQKVDELEVQNHSLISGQGGAASSSNSNNVLVQKLENTERELQQIRRENIKLKRDEDSATDPSGNSIKSLEQELSQERKRADEYQERYELLQHMIASERWQYEQKLKSAGIARTTTTSFIGGPSIGVGLGVGAVGNDINNTPPLPQRAFPSSSSLDRSHSKPRPMSIPSPPMASEEGSLRSSGRPLPVPPGGTTDNSNTNTPMTPPSAPKHKSSRTTIDLSSSPLPPSDDQDRKSTSSNDHRPQFKSRLVKPRSFFNRRQ